MNIIEKFISGDASESEILWVEKQFASGELEPYLEKRVKKDWSSFVVTKKRDLSYLFERVLKKINERVPYPQKSLLNKVLDVYLKVAAVLLIPILIGGIIFHVKQQQKITTLAANVSTSSISAPLGSRVTFSLPDGTTGYLNSGSAISYTIPFQENRKVGLKGEAWFDVVKNSKYPFQINAGKSTVKVLGTTFNLSAYPDDDYIEIVLEDGKVEFKATATAKATNLGPGERLIFSNKTIKIENVEPRKYSGWTKGELIFKGDKMEEVAKRIERWYNVKVQIADVELYDYSFRGTFVDDSLKGVLRLLSMTSPIKYEIIPRQMTDNDTWEKEKVILSIKN